MSKHKLQANLDEVTERDVQEFWTERPMIHPGYGFDIDSASPEKIFVHMERLMRDKGVHMQPIGAPLLSNHIDYGALKGKKALEIGYGVGWLTNELAKVCAHVDGIDLSDSHYRLSTHRFRNTPNVHLQVASAEDIPFPDETFDFVCAYGVIHHAANDRRCYEEIFRILRPGGKCFLMLYRRGGPKFWMKKVVREGILGGGLARHGWDFTRFIYSITDNYQNDSPGAPISRHYTRRDIRERFKRFLHVDLRISGNEGEWRNLPFDRLPLTNLLPRRVLHALVRRSGAYWMVTLFK